MSFDWSHIYDALLPWLQKLKFWEWPERFMKWLKVYQELREAKYKANKAEAEANAASIQAPTVEWVAKVADMKRKLRQLYNAEKAKHPGRNILVQIQRSPDDDLDVFNEAMRQLRAEEKHSGDTQAR